MIPFISEWFPSFLKGFISEGIQNWRFVYILKLKLSFFYSRCFGSSCFQTTSGENFPYENSKPKCFHPPRKLWNNTRQNGTNVTQSKLITISKRMIMSQWVKIASKSLISSFFICLLTMTAICLQCQLFVYICIKT